MLILKSGCFPSFLPGLSCGLGILAWGFACLQFFDTREPLTVQRFFVFQELDQLDVGEFPKGGVHISTAKFPAVPPGKGRMYQFRAQRFPCPVTAQFEMLLYLPAQVDDLGVFWGSWVVFGDRHGHFVL